MLRICSGRSSVKNNLFEIVSRNVIKSRFENSH